MQHIGIVICKQNQEIIATSEFNFVDILIRGYINPTVPGILSWLETIDPYGNTIYNRLQIKFFVKDMEKLKEMVKEDELKKMIDGIILFAQKVEVRPHLYLKFIGD